MLHKQEFNSINEFYKYICDTPFNEAFRWAEHQSVDRGRWAERRTKTNSFEEAVALMKKGWTEMAQQMTQKLKATPDMELIHQMRTVIGVAGFQPIVPLYLAGVPTNMVSKQMVPIKQKVINVTKSVDYSGSVSSDKIVEESIKAMQIVKKLESQGYRVNLYITLGSFTGGTEIVCKVKVKGANEKLNVSKLAFPLAHPSMLRRLLFRWIEVIPNVTKSFIGNYGSPATYSQLKKAFPNDVVLPAIFKCDIDEIKSVEDIRASF